MYSDSRGDYNIHPFIFQFFWSLSEGPRGIIRVPTHDGTQLHTHLHTVDNLEMTIRLQRMYFGLREETRVPGGNSRSPGRTRELCAQGGRRIQTPSPGGARQGVITNNGY